jgi:hypothetical protein
VRRTCPSATHAERAQDLERARLVGLRRLRVCDRLSRQRHAGIGSGRTCRRLRPREQLGAAALRELWVTLAVRGCGKRLLRLIAPLFHFGPALGLGALDKAQGGFAEFLARRAVAASDDRFIRLRELQRIADQILK